jgi:N-acetylglucosamine kinase-like BadF-type ATPase
LFQTALQSDSVALDILAEFGVAVSRYLVAGIKNYGLQTAKIDIVLSGGVFKARNAVLFETIGAEIHHVAPQANIINALYEPVVGAVLWALDGKYGGDLPAAIMANCRASAAELDLIRAKA